MNYGKVVTDTQYIDKDNIKIVIQIKGDTLYIIKKMKVDYGIKKEEIKVHKQEAPNTFKDKNKCNDDWDILAYILYALVLYLLATRYNN